MKFYTEIGPKVLKETVFKVTLLFPEAELYRFLLIHSEMISLNNTLSKAPPISAPTIIAQQWRLRLDMIMIFSKFQTYAMKITFVRASF
jgi:hypothetical protein